MINLKIGIKRKISCRKMKRSLNERHKYTKISNNFHSMFPPLLPSSCFFPGVSCSKLSLGAIFTIYSDIFIPFWLRKISVSAELYNLSFLCIFVPLLAGDFPNFRCFSNFCAICTFRFHVVYDNLHYFYSLSLLVETYDGLLAIPI